MTNRPRRTSGAFTSIEVLAATLLAASLMIALLGVTGGIAKKEKLLSKDDSQPAWHDQLVRQIAEDLRQSQTFRSQSDRLALMGHGSRDSQTGNATWLPTEVHYFVVSVGKESVLMRQEFPQTLPSRPGKPEIMCLGIDGIGIGVAGEIASPSGGQRSSPAAPNATEEGAIPHRVRIALTNGDAVVLDRSLILF